jgi:carbamoyltransferase
MTDKILWGVTFGAHDAAIAVFVNNELEFATDAERFSRKKNDSVISSTLIEYVENKYGMPDKVYYYENPILKSLRRTWAGQRPRIVIPEFKYKLTYSNHHESHAAYGYYTSPFDECTVLVIDAIGEWDTLTTWQAKNGKLKRKGLHWRYPKSLGLFYSAATQAAGWKPNEEEYIMMGAAAIGEITHKGYSRLSELWKNKFNFHRGVKLNDMDPLEIAACAQALYESLFHQILIKANPELGPLVFVGGCALNVKANSQLNPCDVHIPSNPGDAGSAIGCVLSRIQQKISPSPYLGYEIKGEYPVDEIVKKLRKKKIIGVAKGKAEFGPRALGNRSLLGDPSVKNIKDIMNKIKGREKFRPFAVMILKEDVQKYFSGSVNSPYMNVAYKTHSITDKKYPGIVHADGTTRLQIVDDSDSHRKLLEAWKKKTGCPMILNTSLNIKGEPIVNDEYDIKKFTLNTGVEVL